MRNSAQKFKATNSFLSDNSFAPTSTRRLIADLLESLDTLSKTSPSFVRRPSESFEVNGQLYELPRYLFLGPKGGDAPIRIAIFAGIHGDEPAGPLALLGMLAAVALVVIKPF